MARQHVSADCMRHRCIQHTRGPFNLAGCEISLRLDELAPSLSTVWQLGHLETAQARMSIPGP
eukprot:8755375-Pyramimonas_sp.AAC.1